MISKTSSHSRQIADRDILSLYETVIPLLSDNPEGLELTDKINQWLLRFVRYDFDHYIMADLDIKGFPTRFNVYYEKWDRFTDEDEKAHISVRQRNRATADATFEESVERSYQDAIAHSKIRNPEIHQFHYFRFESKSYPQVVIGLFRRRYYGSKNPFTRDEKNILGQLAPHIIAVARAAMYQHSYLNQSFQYFTAIAKLGSELGTDYKLSDSELRLIPNILSGENNEQIAEKHFISVETVKSHIKHILKKTGTKNRIDFIGKFFTSTENVRV